MGEERVAGNAYGIDLWNYEREDLYERYYNYKQTNNAYYQASRRTGRRTDRIQSQRAVQVGRAAVHNGRQKVFDKQRYSIQIPQQWYVDKVEKYVVEMKCMAA